MDDTSMWLQDSVHLPDPLGGSHREDIEEELRLMRRDPGFAATQQQTPVSSQQPAAAPIATLSQRSGAATSAPTSRQPAAPFSSSQRTGGGFGASLTMAAPTAPLTTPRGTPVTTPTSSQPGMAGRAPRPSMAAADFLVQQQFQQATEALHHTKRELADALEEVALLTKTTNTEKETANMWRTRYQSEVSKADEALTQAQIRARNAIAERDEAVAATRRAEADFAAARAEWQRHADDRADLRRQLDDAMAGKDAAERQIRALERRVQDLGDTAAANERLREQLATLDNDFRAVRDESLEVQRQLESNRVEYEIRLQAVLDSQRQDFEAEMRTLEEDFNTKMTTQQQHYTEQLNQARQRLSQGEQAREEARRAQEQLAEVRDRVASLEAELQRAKEQHERTKQRLEAARATEVELMKEEHEAAVRRLIDEHNEERAELRRRLSQGEAATSRLMRLEADLTAERERADEQQQLCEDARRELEEARRASTRRDEVAELANRRAFEAETRLAELEASASETLSREKQQLHDRIEGLLAQLEMAGRDHAAEAEEFSEQLQEARQRQSAAEATLAELRSQFSKERLALIKNESAARGEVNQIMEERDEAIRCRRQAESRAADAEAHAQALDRRVMSLEEALADLRAQAHVEQREVHARGVELQHARAHIDQLEARLSQQQAPMQQHQEGRRAIGGQMLQRQQQQQQQAAAPASGVHSQPQSNAPSPSPAPINPRLQQENLYELPPQMQQCAAVSAQHPQRYEDMAPQQPERRVGQRYPVSSACTPAASVPLTMGGGAGEALTPRVPFGTESLNTLHTVSTKRHRSEEPQQQAHHGACRVFAMTGFDQRAISDDIVRLPDAEVAQVMPNAPIPSTVTHLLSSGQLTVKLLTALVKGCWVLPEAYLTASLRAERWMPEEQYGFRHKRPILQSRVFAFTDNFKGTRHFATAVLVATEGGADVRDRATLDDACDIPQCTVLCTPQETRDVRSAYPALHLMTWDALVKLIYPPNAMPQVPAA